MGIYYYAANHDRREILTPHPFEETQKLTDDGLPWGDGTRAAFLLLMMSRWAGDRVEVFNDAAGSGLYDRWHDEGWHELTREEIDEERFYENGDPKLPSSSPRSLTVLCDFCRKMLDRSSG